MEESLKDLKRISWVCSEEEYRADPAYSYSTLAKYNREGFNKLNTLFDKVESPSLTFGSAVDSIITGGEEEFNERFFVADFPEIQDSQRKIVDTLYKDFGNTYQSLLEIPDSTIINYTEQLKFQLNWKPETRVKVLRNDCSYYYNLLLVSEGKTILDNNTYTDVLDCVDALKGSDATKWYFAKDNPFDGINRYYQLKFKGEWEGIPLRCMADLIIVDHKNKVIIPCDLKTSSKKEWKFYKSFIEWNYWIQAQLYWYIIRQNLDKDEVYKDYKLLDYRFIVISRNSGMPLVWIYPDTQVITDCTYGSKGQYVCRNWRTIVKELHYYLTHSPEYPIGVTEINDIKSWLNQE